tara:strand:- start:257 stop:1864 length:1608 start_codon:yes stop_codon:yes gene_type:complete
MMQIVSKRGQNLLEEEKEFYNSIGSPDLKKLRVMSRRIRFQRGMRDRYYEGLGRSYYYLDYIRKEFANQGIPEELAYLPHVESSFNFLAYSKVGAAGMWQFMRSTARLYKMKMNYLIDERRDPHLSTKAAGRLLKTNFKKLGAWPLAITAYNHGARSLLRAIKQLNTTDIGEIVKKYQGRRFGFASKNFYASFMAVVEISKRPEKYFGPQVKLTLEEVSEIKLPKTIKVRLLSKVLGVSLNKLQFLNPKIRPHVFRRNYKIPSGYNLKIPKKDDILLGQLRLKLEKIKPILKLKKKVATNHIVKSGESLYSISKLHKKDMAELMLINNLSSYDILFPGQEIKLRKSKVSTARKSMRNKNFRLMTIDEVFKGEKALDQRLSRKFGGLYSLNAMESYFDFRTKKVGRKTHEFYLELEETLGHFSDWSGVPLSKVLVLNGWINPKRLRIGQRIILPLDDKGLRQFLLKRKAFHQQKYLSFIEKNEVNGSFDYVVKRGDTLEFISKKLELPLWLVRGSNLFSQNLSVGQKITFPKVKSL